MTIPAYAIYTTESRVPERQTGRMPIEFKRRVCLCKDVDPALEYAWLTSLPKRNGLMYVHTKCGKPESYFLYRCINGCGLFLKDFNALFCWAMPTCWECSKDAVALACVGNDIPYHSGDWDYDGNLIPPQLAQPRIYSSEELGDLSDLVFTI